MSVACEGLLWPCCSREVFCSIIFSPSTPSHGEEIYPGSQTGQGPGSSEAEDQGLIRKGAHSCSYVPTSLLSVLHTPKFSSVPLLSSQRAWGKVCISKNFVSASVTFCYANSTAIQASITCEAPALPFLHLLSLGPTHLCSGCCVHQPHP